MYLHIIILTAVFFQFSILPFSANDVLAENTTNRITSDKFCNIPLPDPKKLSKEEKEWFTTFQEGTFYVQGWKEISAEIINKIQHESEKKALRRSLNLLGIRIGCEWSKRNDIRKIDTDMLEKWGAELQETAEKKPDKLPVLIADIQHKVVELVD